MFVDFFIHRPVFATVCALIIILGGAVVVPSLPISQFPNLTPPQVSVRSDYIGASPGKVSVRGRILRMCRGRCQWRTVGITFELWVAPAGTDGGHRTPEGVGILRVKTPNERVGLARP